MRLAALLALGLTAASSLSAQTKKIAFPDASPAATVTQRVGVTDLSVSYSRPSVKGRKILGGLVPYGEVWRTGANTSTHITFSTPVSFNGTQVPEGTYELFSIPTPTSWTVILQKDNQEWGAYSYDKKNDVARFEAKPETLAAPVESFGFEFSDLTPDSAILSFSWDTFRVPIKLKVDVASIMQPRIEAAMAGDGKKPYFQAAEFYYQYGLDLKQAVAWIDAAIKADPKPNLYLLYHKALYLAKLGDKSGATAAATESLKLTQAETGPEKGEYTRLNQTLLDSLK